MTSVFNQSNIHASLMMAGKNITNSDEWPFMWRRLCLIVWNIIHHLGTLK